MNKKHSRLYDGHDMVQCISDIDMEVRENKKKRRKNMGKCGGKKGTKKK